jgi:hypothetical protein
MNEQLKQSIATGEAKHKKHLWLFRIGRFLETYAKRGFRPFADGELKGIITLVGRAVLLLILLGITQNLLYMVIGYLIVHGIAFVVGSLLRKHNSVKLHLLSEDYNALWEQYLDAQTEANDMVGGIMVYDGGIVISSGAVTASMDQDRGKIDIYQLDKTDEMLTYDQRRHDHEEKGLAFSEKLASVKLRKNFGIYIEKGQEIPCTTFFSPVVQVKMTDSKQIANFSAITMDGPYFHAKTQHSVPSPGRIDTFTTKPFAKYFEDVDRYCADMRKMGDAVYGDVQSIRFLLGHKN